MLIPAKAELSTAQQRKAGLGKGNAGLSHAWQSKGVAAGGFRAGRHATLHR